MNVESLEFVNLSRSKFGTEIIRTCFPWPSLSRDVTAVTNPASVLIFLFMLPLSLNILWGLSCCGRLFIATERISFSHWGPTLLISFPVPFQLSGSQNQGHCCLMAYSCMFSSHFTIFQMHYLCISISWSGEDLYPGKDEAVFMLH